ncbi:unnamed protein product [Fusarium graminearum]|uniref:Major facilitator superfamily (MFS) profile domain-containing protein n=1 Tax=Gibberella zeae TaxID=5518 RepID=A0A9N8RKI9_GIBZA|nr:unnamed protein product [Fusarium graminearum]
MNSVATSLPTISEALDAGPTVTWVGTSYLLGQLSFQPLYGRISDITGRKPVLLFSMGCIVVGGVLCGFARTPIWLYICRTISGIGGGGISSSVAIIVSDLVSLRSRGKYQGFISLAIVTGAASGPFVAAGLIQMTADGWRWAFWVPAIMGAVCFVLLIFLLPLKPVSGSLKDKVRKIDWWGVLASIAGIVLTVMSINSGGSIWAWKNVKTISMMTIGIIMILVFIIIEALFAKIPIIPLRLFKQRYMPILRAGFTVWTLGAGLKLLFNRNTHIAVYIVVLAVEGAGIGWVRQPGLVALQANSAEEDRAVATGTRNVFRSLGGVVGIAVSTAVYYAVLDKALQTDNTIPDSLRGSVLDGTCSVEDPKTEHYVTAILNARMQGFRIIFIITVPLLALCLGASFLVDDIILKGDIGRSGDQGAAMTTEPARDIKRG